MPYYHVVKSGDTMSGIAELYRCRLEDVAKANKATHSNPGLIYPGDRLVIPDSRSAGIYLTIKNDMHVSALHYDTAVEQLEKQITDLLQTKARVMKDHMNRLKNIQSSHYHTHYLTKVTTKPDGYHDTKLDVRQYCQHCGAELNGIDRKFSDMIHIGVMNETGQPITNKNGEGHNEDTIYPGMNYNKTF